MAGESVGTFNDLPVYQIEIASNYDSFTIAQTETYDAVLATLVPNSASYDSTTYPTPITADSEPYAAAKMTFSENAASLPFVTQQSNAEYSLYKLQKGGPPFLGGGDKGYLVIEWKQGGSVNSNTTDLQAALAVASARYAESYQADDRYNGKTTAVDLKAAELTELSSEKDEFSSYSAAAQEQGTAALASSNQGVINRATEILNTTTENLISTANINPTLLYEAANRELAWWGNTIVDYVYTGGWGDNPKVSADNTTAASWNAYQTALANANAILGMLYDASGEPTDYNSSTEGSAADDVEAAEQALQAAIDGLEPLATEIAADNAAFAYSGLKNLTAKIFDPSKMAESDYTADSWSAFLSARTAAQEFLSLHSAPAAFGVIGIKEAQAYISAYSAFWNACYQDLHASTSGTATLYVTDNYAVLNGVTPLPSAGVYELAVGADSTLGNALAAQFGEEYYYAFDHSDSAADARGVYVNGVYVFNFAAGNSVSSGIDSRGYQDILLHPGDVIVLAVMEQPMGTNASGTPISVPVSELRNKVNYLTVEADGAEVITVDAVAGTPAQVTARATYALPQAYTGGKFSISGASVYVSDCCATREDALCAVPTNNAGVVTDSSGNFALSLYTAAESTEGWYSLTLIPSGDMGGLTNGPTVLVHITDPEDLSEIRAELLAKLDEVYTAYGDDFYTESQLAEIDELYETAKAALMEEDASSGDLYAAYETAYSGITAIQQANEASTEIIQKNINFALKYLPSPEDASAGKIYNIDKMVLDFLFGTDGWFTRMTEYQRNLLSGNEMARLNVLKSAYEQSNNGENLPVIPAFTLTIEVRDAGSGELISNLPILDDSPVYFIDSLTWSDEYQDIVTTSSEHPIAFNEGTTAYTLPKESIYTISIHSFASYSDLGEYEVDRFEFGIDEYYRVSAESQVDYYTLRDDATVIEYLRINDPDAAALQTAKANALAELKEAFEGYKRQNYTEENWAILLEAYREGEKNINAATDQTAVSTAKQTALSAMAAVPVKSVSSDGIPNWGVGSAFDAGTKVGTVTVTVENNTFPGGAFTGMILNQPDYAIGENDNMMTVILRALADAGFDWEGTGGATSNGFDISYLAKIKKDGQEMGEFSGDPGSGWMGALNDFMVNEGFSQFSVASGMLGDGDVISVMFTQNLGVDLGGSWGNSDTTLKSLDVSTGSLIPGFASGEAGNTYDFALMIPGNSASILVTPHAANINYMVKTFLNEKVTSNDIGNSFYRRTETINVHPGDVIYVGCGERAWPSMNKQGDEASAYTGTWYALHVISANDGADYVNEQIAKLPAGNKITLSNYKNVLEQIAVIDQVKAALSSSEQAKVNTSTLEAARERAESFKAVDEVKALLAALPKSSNLSDSEVVAARRQIEAADAAYKALTDEQKGYITVGDVANYNELVERLTKLTPDTTAETITGSTATGDEVKLSAEEIKEAADENGSLAVETENGTVKLDAATLDALAETGEDVVVSVTENEDGTVTVDVTVDGETIDADVKVELPATGEGQVLVIVHPDGTEEIIKKSLVEDGTVYAELPAGATVKVIDNAVSFTDVADSAWYADEVEFASSHGLFQGVGNNKFAPAAPMTRAMLATVLYRLEDAVATGANPFADVADGTWYTEAVIWASAEGIVQGTGKGFEPNENITREQIATMLYRYAKTIGLDVSGSAALDKFSDGDKTSSWAKDAMQWAVSVGLFQGDDVGTLRPQGDATRAEVAALLMRMVKLIVK